ncbi:aliphatic sulfonate ABC transporter substrate-binding protein [Tianweitania sp. BSSL-BM11]|uniref:Aliphatic sulfonate ABC transporter substrate-binding protein n=1 Tax=Tianweitania aestuarii TaxID=2814886 RepID=A0ABS5RWP6_9HYPH|nr:aliphatic sulfonate ABC transporter substrate-binding protein [Tianweitania aestuarii]MBS9721451.1 aliphatic sulfonate ABC transporter substrate-binding protein [Tianweitania aestuarii]
MNVFRRTVLAGLAATALFGGCMWPAVAAEVEVSKVSYGGSPWLSHYPVWVGIKKGLFAQHGLEVQWQSFSTGSARMSSLAIGEIDFGGTGSISAIALMASGAKAFYVIAAPDSYATVEGIITTPDINSVADLKGKKLGVPFATSSHVLALDVLEQAGLDPNKDVTLINLPSSDAPSALMAKQVDAVTTWTPAFNSLKAQPNTKVLLDAREFSLYKQFKLGPGPDLLVVNQSFADKNPKSTTAFLQGYFEASQFIKDNPDEAAKILMELTQLPMDEQSNVLKDIEWIGLADQQKMLSPDGTFTKGLQSLADFLVRHKQIDTAPRIDQWVKAELLP